MSQNNSAFTTEAGLREALAQVTEAINNALNYGNVAADMSGVQLQIQRIIQTQRAGLLLPVFADDQYQIVWNFVFEWTTFLKMPNGDVAEFLAQQRKQMVETGQWVPHILTVPRSIVPPPIPPVVIKPTYAMVAQSHTGLPKEPKRAERGGAAPQPQNTRQPALDGQLKRGDRDDGAPQGQNARQPAAEQSRRAERGDRAAQENTRQPPTEQSRRAERGDRAPQGENTHQPAGSGHPRVVHRSRSADGTIPSQTTTQHPSQTTTPKTTTSNTRVHQPRQNKPPRTHARQSTGGKAPRHPESSRQRSMTRSTTSSSRTPSPVAKQVLPVKTAPAPRAKTAPAPPAKTAPAHPSKTAPAHHSKTKPQPAKAAPHPAPNPLVAAQSRKLQEPTATNPVVSVEAKGKAKVSKDVQECVRWEDVNDGTDEDYVPSTDEGSRGETRRVVIAVAGKGKGKGKAKAAKGDASDVEVEISKKRSRPVDSDSEELEDDAMEDEPARGRSVNPTGPKRSRPPAFALERVFETPCEKCEKMSHKCRVRFTRVQTEDGNPGACYRCHVMKFKCLRTSHDTRQEPMDEQELATLNMLEEGVQPPPAKRAKHEPKQVIDLDADDEKEPPLKTREPSKPKATTSGEASAPKLLGEPSKPKATTSGEASAPKRSRELVPTELLAKLRADLGTSSKPNIKPVAKRSKKDTTKTQTKTPMAVTLMQSEEFNDWAASFSEEVTTEINTWIAQIGEEVVAQVDQLIDQKCDAMSEALDRSNLHYINNLGARQYDQSLALEAKVLEQFKNLESLFRATQEKPIMATVGTQTEPEVFHQEKPIVAMIGVQTEPAVIPRREDASVQVQDLTPPTAMDIDVDPVAIASTTPIHPISAPLVDIDMGTLPPIQASVAVNITPPTPHASQERSGVSDPDTPMDDPEKLVVGDGNERSGDTPERMPDADRSATASERGQLSAPDVPEPVPHHPSGLAPPPWRRSPRHHTRSPSPRPRSARIQGRSPSPRPTS